MTKNFSSMTFNIKNSADEKDKQSINYWTNRREKIVKIIEKYNPTVIGFQEVLIDQLDYLKENLSNEYSFYGVGRNDGKVQGEFNPILFNRKLLISKRQKNKKL
ncbi:MAG: endonuclease/exonuclease/phosphatase family protein [Promethearchaeota archaeon]